MQGVQQWVWGMFAQEAKKWPPELREALAKVEVDIVRQPGQVLIAAKGSEGDPNVDRAKELVLDALMGPIPQVVGAFQCRVKVFK